MPNHQKANRVKYVALAMLLGGCANTAPNPAQVALAAQPLYCKDKAQCDLYWQRAQGWLAQHSRYRIQTATDTVINTYGPLRSEVDLAYQVVRLPRADGSAEIQAHAACDNMFGCQPSPIQGIAAFKAYLNATE